MELPGGKREYDLERLLLCTGRSRPQSEKARPAKQLGANGAGLERVLSGQLCQSHDPIIVAVHLVSPKIHWLDRGKGAISLRGPDGDGIRDEFEEGEYYARETIPDDGSVASKLIAAVKVVTKRWRKQKLQEIHHHELGSDDARR